MRIVTPLLSLLTLLLWSLPALAADDAAALLQEAVRRYGLADFEGSLEQLTRAQEMTKDPKLLARIHLYQGINYGELDRLPLSQAAFTTALTFEPDICPDPARFKASLVKLCQEVRRSLRGTLAVTSQPEGGQVLVDGEPVGQTPLERRLAIGSHRVQVRVGDRHSPAQRVTVFVDQTASVKVELPPAGVTLPPRAKPDRPAAPPRPRPRRRLWTWIAAGSAVLVAGIAAGVWASAESDYGEWEETADDPAADEQRLTDLQDRVQRKEVAAWVLFGTAGALAAGAVTLFFLEGKASGAERSGTMSVVPILGPAPGAAVTLRF